MQTALAEVATRIFSQKVLPRWLNDWHLGTSPPATVAEIDAVLAATESSVKPTPTERLYGHLAEGMCLWMHRFAPGQWKQLSHVYADALANLPEDLLVKTLRTAHRECIHPPTPAELLEFVADEMAERTIAVARLTVARRVVEEEEAS